MKLVVMTSRRDPPTIAQTMSSLSMSGWDRTIEVSSDPTGLDALRDLRHHARVRVVEWPHGVWHDAERRSIAQRAGLHYALCLRRIAESPDGGVIVEDDVIARDGWIDELHSLVERAWHVLPSGRFALVLYSRYDPAKMNRASDLETMPSITFFGTQAMYWTQRAAQEVAAYLYEHAYECNELVYDLLIGQFADSDAEFELLLPDRSSFQHVGRMSDNFGPFHASPTFREGAPPTDTIMLTAGIGDEWAARAKRVASRFLTLNPWATVRAITEWPSCVPKLASPHWIKAHAWDLVPSWARQLIWIDADAVPVQPIGDDFPRADFAAVPDLPISATLQRSHIPEWNVGRPCVNTGVFAATRKTQPAFEVLKALHTAGAPAWYHAFYEQSWLNYALQVAHVDVARAPNRYNWLPGFGPTRHDVAIVHSAGGSHSGLSNAWDLSDQMLGWSVPNAPPLFARSESTLSPKRVRVYRGHNTIVKQPPRR